MSMFLKKTENKSCSISLFIVPLLLGVFLSFSSGFLHDIIIIKLYAQNFTSSVMIWQTLNFNFEVQCLPISNCTRGH